MCIIERLLIDNLEKIKAKRLNSLGIALQLITGIPITWDGNPVGQRCIFSLYSFLDSYSLSHYSALSRISLQRISILRVNAPSKKLQCTPYGCTTVILGLAEKALSNKD